MVVGDETNMDDLGNDELHEWPSELLGILMLNQISLVVKKWTYMYWRIFSQC